MAKDSLVALAGPKLRKEDSQVWVVRVGLVPPLPHGTGSEVLEV